MCLRIIRHILTLMVIKQKNTMVLNFFFFQQVSLNYFILAGEKTH